MPSVQPCRFVEAELSFRVLCECVSLCEYSVRPARLHSPPVKNTSRLGSRINGAWRTLPQAHILTGRHCDPTVVAEESRCAFQRLPPASGLHGPQAFSSGVDRIARHARLNSCLSLTRPIEAPGFEHIDLERQDR